MTPRFSFSHFSGLTLKAATALCMGVVLSACSSGDPGTHSAAGDTTSVSPGASGQSPIQTNPANPGGVPNGGVPGAAGMGHR